MYIMHIMDGSVTSQGLDIPPLYYSIDIVQCGSEYSAEDTKRLFLHFVFNTERSMKRTSLLI